ncbi:hypothetical protein Tco_1040813 [Tanacetum coccineum]|uniref:Uncharacterized protein n=1 Tax=Tanacetum coccineum TaxID=301880 RepID=A0ABQ5GFF8_9ASTR
MTSKAQQIAQDDALAAPENRRVIGKCNMRINPGMKPKEPTYQVVLDALSLITCYPAFLITAKVPVIYMHKYILKIYPRIPGQEFVEPPTEEEALLFIRELGHSGEIKYITDVSGLDKIRLSRVQILWGMYYKKNLDFAALIWEDLAYQIDNKDSKKQDKIMFMHTARDDSLLGTMRFITRHEDAQIYGVILPKAMMNQTMLDFVAYQTYYAIASGVEPPKSKKPKMKFDSAISFEETPSKKKPTKAKKDVPSKKKPASKPKPTKKKAPVEADRGKDEGTNIKPGVPDVPKYLFESENESWGDSDDDESNDDNSDEVTKNDDEDDVESDANDDNETSDSKKIDSDEDENLNLNLNDDEEEDKEEEDIRTPNSFEFNDDDEEYDELYKDVNVRSKVTRHEEVGKGDAKMTDTTHESASQENSYEQVIEDAHVTLTSSQKTEGSKQSSSVSSDFASKFLNLDNVPPVIDEVASMINVKTSHEELSTQAPPNLSVPVMAIPKASIVHVTTVTMIIQPFSSIPQTTRPTPTPTTEPTTSSIPTLLDFASLFGFDQRMSALEQDLSQFKQSYTAEFEKKAQAEKEKYTDIIKKSVKEIIKDKVKSQLPQILPKEISDFATTKILLGKLEKSQSYRAAKQHRDLYDALVKSYQLDKDLFDSYGKMYSLKRGREDKDKDEDPPAGPDQGSSKGSKSKSESSGKSAQAEEPVFETADTEMPQDQGDDMGNTEDQPNVEEASKHDWFKKPERPPTPDRDWNAGKQIDFRPPQTWISKMAKSGKPPNTFDELMSNPIDFSAYVLHNLKIENLTQEHLVGPAFNLLKGACKSRVELEFHFKECYKAVTDKLDWHNPEGHEYSFDLSKPLPLIKDQGRQVVPANYFFNNDLEYLKGGSSSVKYITSTTKTKAAKYDNIEGIKDMVQTLWSLVKVAYDKHAIWGTSQIILVTNVKVVKKYGYGYLEEIIVRREDHKLYKFKEGDFPKHNLRDIEDMLLLLVQKKLSNLEKYDLFDLNVALRMSDITKMTPYTAYNDPQGIIYQDKLQRNRLIRLDELYKFCDGTLSSVRRVLHDIASSLEMDYLLKRIWSKLDRKRSRIMIKAIDQQLFEKRLMRNMEKFVGGREYKNDFRQLERTI